IILFIDIPSPFTKTECLILMFALSLEGVIAIGTAWLRMQDDKAKVLLTIMVTTTLLQVIFIVIALALWPHIISVLLGGLLAALIQFFWLHYYNNYTISLPNLALAKNYLYYSSPVMLSGVVSFFLNGAERWFIAANSSLESLGVYAIAAKFAFGMCILVQPFTMWWMPRRFAVLEQDNCKGLEAVRITHLGLIYIAFLTIVVVTMAYLIIHLLLPNTYQQAALFILFLLPIAMLKEWGELFNLAILYKRKTQWLLGINIVAAITAISLLFALSSLGIFSVFIALYSAQLCRLVLTYWSAQICLCLPYDISLMVILQVVTGLALFLIYYLQSLTAAILISLTTSFILLGIASKYISNNTF
ncbi:lipopolysaccharide biosynthesis protein, partial [Vibrio agarivorans]